MFYGGYGGGFPGHGYPTGPFEQSFHVYSAAHIDKPHLENGDKVIMPPSALDRLASLHIDYPMLFEVTNPEEGRTSHCGVLEFSADEGLVYMPYWMMQNLLLSEGDLVKFKSATLPKGTYVKLQPHTKDFLDISNPKAVLETTLRSFSCLTVNDTIMVAYNKKKYHIDIVETKPPPAISIIETDCEVDFAAPLDYVEPERRPQPAPAAPAAPTAGPSGREAAAEPEPEEPKFTPFVGSGRRLDGKPSKLGSPSNGTASSSAAAAAAARAGGGATSTARSTPGGGSSTSGAAPPAAAAGPGRPAGKLVFGGGAQPGTSSAAAAKDKGKAEAKKEPEPAKEERKFEAFKGKGHKLKG